MRRLTKMHLFQDVGRNIDLFKISRQYHFQAKKIKLLSLQGNDFTKMKNTKTVPDSYLILIVLIIIRNGQFYRYLFGDSA